MSVFNSLNTALYSKLTGGTALTALLSSGTAIYYQKAPEGATLPYVVFSQQGGGPDNDNPGDNRTLLYYVRGYTTSPAASGTIDTQISSLLHRGTVTVSGYTNFWISRDETISLAEREPTNEYIYSSGAVYRIRISS